VADFDAVAELQIRLARQLRVMPATIDVMTLADAMDAIGKPPNEPPGHQPGEPLVVLGELGDKPSDTPAINYDDVANHLAAQGKRTQAALVRFVKDKSSAQVEEVAFNVHGDCKTSGNAVAQNVSRTNRSLEEMEVPLSFRMAGSMIHKRVSRK
jgi:hypothetical protein